MKRSRIAPLLALTATALCSAACEDSSASVNLSPGPLALYEPKVIVSSVSSTGHDRFYGTAVDADGNVFAVGHVAQSTDSSADFSTVVAKFGKDGVLDGGFGDQGYAILNVAVGTNGEVFRGIVVQSDGKVVVAGPVEHAGAADPRDRDLAVVRFTASGTPDASFGTNGVAIFDLSDGEVVGSGYVADSAYGLARYPDDRLVVSGGMKRAGATDSDFVLLRLTKDGARDASFGDNGVFSLSLKVSGEDGGEPVDANASPRFLTILPGTEGIIGTGYQPIPGKDTGPVVYKVTDAGQLDTRFGGGTGVFTTMVLSYQAEVYEALAQGDKLVTTGYGRSSESQGTDILSMRLNADGTLDPSYGQGGFVQLDVAGFNDNSRLLKILPDRRVVLVGGGRPTMDNADSLVAILTPDGQPDTSFAPKGYKLFDMGGIADFVWGVQLSPDGKVLAASGVRGVGSMPMNGANDDAVLVMMRVAE